MTVLDETGSALGLKPGLATRGLSVAYGGHYAVREVSLSAPLGRITGLIGTSSNPVSGMTIATLILTCSIFVALGWTGDVYAPIALSVGATTVDGRVNSGSDSWVSMSRAMLRSSGGSRPGMSKK